MPNPKQKKALEALETAKVVTEYTDGSLDIEWEGNKLAMDQEGEVMTIGKYLEQVNLKKEKEEKKKGKKTPWDYAKPSYSVTPCQLKPELCKPRKIKHVAWDADDTIWDIRPVGIASSVTGELELVDPDTVVETREYKPWTPSVPKATKKPKDEGLRYKYGYRYTHPGYEEEFGFYYPPESEEETGGTAEQVESIMDELTAELSEMDKEFLGIIGKTKGEEVKLLTAGKPPEKEPPKKETKPEYSKTTIKLMPGYRDTLKELRERGITNSIISLNTEGTVKRIIDTFGLTDNFIEIRDSWDNKGKVFNEQMKKYHINPKQAMFIDNMLSHVQEVSKSGAIPLVFGKDIKEVAQVLEFIKNA